MLDWSKPIEFENGQPCELIETNHDGWQQWGARQDGTYPTRLVHRLGIDESTMGGAMSSHWFMHEDGISNWPPQCGDNIINKAWWLRRAMRLLLRRLRGQYVWKPEIKQPH